MALVSLTGTSFTAKRAGKIDQIILGNQLRSPRTGADRIERHAVQLQPIDPARLQLAELRQAFAGEAR